MEDRRDASVYSATGIEERVLELYADLSRGSLKKVAQELAEDKELREAFKKSYRTAENALKLTTRIVRNAAKRARRTNQATLQWSHPH